MHIALRHEAGRALPSGPTPTTHLWRPPRLPGCTEGQGAVASLALPEQDPGGWAGATQKEGPLVPVMVAVSQGPVFCPALGAAHPAGEGGDVFSAGVSWLLLLLLMASGVDLCTQLVCPEPGRLSSWAPGL